jgi:hypothetical protein
MKLLIFLFCYYFLDKLIQKSISYQFVFLHFFFYTDLTEVKLAIEKQNQTKVWMIILLFWQNTDFSQVYDIDFHNFNLKDSINCFCQVHNRILR